MNSSDTERRSQQPTIWAYRGNGVNIKFICARCDKPHNQKGSKLRFYMGLRRKVCAKCDQEMVR